MPLLHSEIVDLGAFRLVALNFVESDNHPDLPRADAATTSRHCAGGAASADRVRPLGTEFTASAGPAEYRAATQ